MLTRKQHELLMFIDRHLRETGFSPSFEEMKDTLQLKSKSGIHRLITALEERGFLKRRHHRARALEVIRLPQDARPRLASSSAASAEVDDPVPHAIGPHPPALRRTSSRAISPSACRASARPTRRPPIQLPMYGRIAAGLPIEALRDDHSTQIEVPVAMLGNGEHYALEVAGNSMIDAGILDGDTVIIRKGETAENGQIVVALVDDTEVTLKRLRRRGNSIALEPCNVRHETRIFPADRVKVQGRMVALLRRY